MKRSVLWIYVGLGVAVVAIATTLIIVFGFVMPSQNAATQFTSASSDLVEAQAALDEQVQAADAVTDTVAANHLAQPALLDTLATQLTTARALLDPPPAMPTDTQAVLGQTAFMRTQASAAVDATQALADTLAAIATSRVSFAKTTLTDTISQANDLYKSSQGKVSKDDVRVALKEATDAAKKTLAATPAAPDETLAAYTDATTALQAAMRAVQDDEASVASATYTYTLTGSAVRTGDNFGDSTIASAKISVTGSSVTVDVCSSPEPITKAATCQTKAGAAPWWTFSGTRSGKVAIVSATTGNPDGFYWGTVTFASTAPQAKATRFVGANGCSRADGSHGTLNTSGEAPYCE